MTLSNGIASERLRSFIERVERLNEELKALNGDKSEVFSEAKGAGFDVKIMKRCIQLRAMDSSDRSEMEDLVDLYMRALDGEIGDDEETGTPVATRVHAHETPHDPETGEIIETEMAPDRAVATGVVYPPSDAPEVRDTGVTDDNPCPPIPESMRRYA